MVALTIRALLLGLTLTPLIFGSQLGCRRTLEGVYGPYTLEREL